MEKSDDSNRAAMEMHDVVSSPDARQRVQVLTENGGDDSNPDTVCVEGTAPLVPQWVEGETFPCEDCTVCFEPMGGACPVRRLACGHGFHHACIQRWLRQSSSCPICKADTPAAPDQPVFKVDLGHQEMSQIMQELEDIFNAIHSCVGPERPIAISGLAYNLCVSIGYEDEDELEEAIGGSLVQFLSALPHFEVVWPESDCEPRATMRPEPTDDLDGPGTRLMFTINDREDLWRVVLQGPKANVEIPEIEFAIRPTSKRRVDTIYNLIASAVFHLGDHVQQCARLGALDPDEASKIVDTINNLNILLDVESPFTVILSDPQGVSELKPSDGAHVGVYEEPLD